MNLHSFTFPLFSKIAENLKDINNWYGVHALMSALQSPPIARLRKTWNIVSSDFPDHYSNYITLSETLNKDVWVSPPDYSIRSIPTVEDFIDLLKAQCGEKLRLIKQHRLRNHWYKTENLAEWINEEVNDLISRVPVKNKSTSHKSGGKGLFHRIKSLSLKKRGSQSSKSMHSHFAPKATELPPNIRNEIDQIQVKEKGAWSLLEIQKLKEFEENEIYKEIARSLVKVQRNAASYNFANNEEVKHFLLFQIYHSMEINMKRSIRLENKKEKTGEEQNEN